jgi:hypothetical protein
MLSWPKSFLTFSASLWTARMAARLKRDHAAANQTRAFKSLLGMLGKTSYWKRAGIEPDMAYDGFRARVAPRGHEQVGAAVERMQRGEADVLWPGRCAFFAASSGTSGGAAKLVPVSEQMLAHFRQAGLDALLHYTARVGHAGVFRGRHLLLGGSTKLVPLGDGKGHEAYAGDLLGIAALNMPPWAESRFYEPGAPVAHLTDWKAKIDAVVARTSSRDISLVAGIPNWVVMLTDALREKNTHGKRRISNLQGLWPNLECFIHGGVPIAPFQDRLRAAFGPEVKFHEVYAAPEGFFAAQDAVAGAGLRVMADAGVFFEFVPMADFDESRLEQLGGKAVPLADVKPGIDYALLVTTPAGLARHLVGDVVRFISTEPPRLIYVGRTKLRLNGFGEHVNFHVAPLAATMMTGQSRGRHEWWIELKPGTLVTPISPQMASELDAELQRLNNNYAARRENGTIEAPTVRLVMPGVFEHWMRYQGKWGGQYRMPRCRSDRLVADELAQVTHFARD